MNNKKYGSKKDIAIVNAVTSLRFIASFLVVPVFKVAGGISAALFSLIFMLTDCIDGFLARKLKSSTFFGALFDGLTDKAYGITSFLTLMTINPVAFSIPLLLETKIMLAQNKKFKNNENVQSSKIGKIKTWFLGGSIILSFLLIDIMDIQPLVTYLKYSSLSKVAAIKDTLALLGIEMPMIITQILTLKSYQTKNKTDNEVKETQENINLEEIKQTENTISKIEAEKKHLKDELNNLEKAKILMNAMLDPEYYDKNKDEPIRKLTKDLFSKNKPTN